MTPSPYDMLPTGKQALTPAGDESAEQHPSMPESPAPGSDHNPPDTEAPDPITDPYGGYREIPLEEGALQETIHTAPAAKPAAPQQDHSDTADPMPEHPLPSVISSGKPSADTADSSDHPQDPVSPDSASDLHPLESELHYDDLQIRNRQNTQEYLLPFEETLLVPDTMPDMNRILFAEGRAASSHPGKTHYSDGDTYSGELLLFTVYCPDSSADLPVEVIRSTIPFQTNACWCSQSANTQENRFYLASVHLKEIRPIKLNERKFQISGTLCITVTEIRNLQLHLLRDTTDPDLILKEETTCAAALIFETEEFTEIDQEFSLEDDSLRPARILKEQFILTETHRQITSGKLIISGMLQTQILYLGEDEDHEKQLCHRSEKTEFSQFIPLHSPLDSNLLEVTLGDDTLKLSIEKQDAFRLEGQIRIQIQGYEKKQIPVITDAYHKEKTIRFDRDMTSVCSLCDVLSGEISAREVISTAEQDQQPAVLLGGSILPAKISAKQERGRIVVEGSVPLRTLALNEDGHPFSMEAEIPLRGALDLSDAAKINPSDTLFVHSAIQELWIDTINSRQIELNVNVSIRVWISSRHDLTSLEQFMVSSEDSRQPSMAIYITDTGDSLWTIAKHYQCDTESLMQLNQITSEAPPAAGTRLLIVR